MWVGGGGGGGGKQLKKKCVYQYAIASSRAVLSQSWQAELFLSQSCQSWQAELFLSQSWQADCFTQPLQLS